MEYTDTGALMLTIVFGIFIVITGTLLAMTYTDSGKKWLSRNL